MVYKSKHWYQRYHLLHNFIRDPILAVFMIFFHDYPILQVSSVTATMIISVVLDIKHKPFREKNHNKMMAIVGVLFVMINVGYCVLAYMSNSLRAKTKHNLVGNMIIVSIACVFIVEILFTSIEVYYSTKESCSKKKKKGKKSSKPKKLEPEEQIEDIDDAVPSPEKKGLMDDEAVSSIFKYFLTKH